MADVKERQSSTTPIMGNGGIQNDTEANSSHHHHHRQAMERSQKPKRKPTTCLIYIVLLVIFQAGVIALFVLTIMKVRTPKFRIRSASFDAFSLGTAANPSFDLKMNAEFSLKNSNFGRYKYRNTTVSFYYGGIEVGQGYVRGSSVGWRSKKKIRVTVDLRLVGGNNNTQLGSDLSAGVLPVTSQAKVRGNVELIFVMKKAKGTEMDCSMEIATSTQQLRNVVCK